MDECLAAVVHRHNGPATVEKVPVPEMEPGGVLVRVEAATLCGTDVHVWHGGGEGPSTGSGQASSAMPYIPGHETAGVIEEIRGEKTDLFNTPLKRGDRVIWTYPFCGHCFYCTVANQPTLCPNTPRFGRARSDEPPYLLGGCAEYHYVPPRSEVVRIPDEVPFPLAASAACALRTIMHGFERLGGIASHETVVIQGAGPVGLYALAVTLDRGAHRTIVVGAPQPRLDLATAIGASETLNLDTMPDAAARKAWLLERTGGRGPDVVIQCAAGSAIAEGLDFIRQGGRYLSIGGGGGPLTVNGGALSTKFLTIVGVRAAEGRHYHQALSFLAARRGWPLSRILTGTYPLAGTGDALSAMSEYREIKAVILPRG